MHPYFSCKLDTMSVHKNKVIFSVCIALCILLFSCEECKEITDVDGNVYNTIKIGDQCWTSENLNVTHYRNGDSIPCVTDSATWVNLTTGAYCDYNNDPSNSAIYGRLYNWYAVNDSRGLVPEGWHVPTYNDWAILKNSCGGEFAGGYLKSNSSWDGSDSYGFSAIPAGFRNNGKFQQLGTGTIFGSSTEYDLNNARSLSIYSVDPTFYLTYHKKTLGYSIRCIKD